MPVNIEMPKLSDTMTEGTLIKWHKKVGDTIEIGDILAEIETDKATMEMEAFDDGVLTNILVQEGAKATIGSILAILNGNATSSPTLIPPAAPSTPPPVPAATPTIPSPLAALTTATTANAGRIKASPLARKLAEELRLDLSAITGTGPGGRIVADDIKAPPPTPIPVVTPPSSEAAAAAALTASIKAKILMVPAQLPPPTVPQVLLPAINDGDEAIQLTTIRKIIASRLLTSKQTIPHFYVHLEADAAPLADLRKLINEQTVQTHGNKYSLNDFILLAVVNAAQTVPAINVSFAGDSIVRFKHIGLAVAIAIDDGLVTPVIKQAGTKSLLTISREVKDFAIRAKERKLKPDEFDGGTITVSNLGAWGIESFDAIINPPQAAILSIGALVEKPVVKAGAVVPGFRINIGLSCDHRAIDGTVAARFLAEVKRLVEHPAVMLL
ncbi:MAG: dihydrolipoamide acetyltransferase family protein [Verrucomicrobia bacterium]|nr:dihydrolipoamide acetyltransferase family protein [Verrucomicrobiota bacterium]